MRDAERRGRDRRRARRTSLCRAGSRRSGSRSRGEATLTRPAPPRSAPWAASRTAPVLPAEPPTTPTCPNVPLCAASGRSGRSALAASRDSTCARTFARSTDSAGKPMSATRIRARVGYRARGRAWELRTSRSDRRRESCRATWPVSLERPDGRSTATQGRPLARERAHHLGGPARPPGVRARCRRSRRRPGRTPRARSRARTRSRPDGSRHPRPRAARGSSWPRGSATRDSPGRARPAATPRPCSASTRATT